MHGLFVITLGDVIGLGILALCVLGFGAVFAWIAITNWWRKMRKP
jgi:hypothetical protein